MSDPTLELELARHQWQEGGRALARAAGDGATARALGRQVDVVSAELARRIGQVFTLAELAALYATADRWSLELLHEALPDELPAQASTAVDAAFELYARRATDYNP